jgi:hypothetical protein
VEANMASDVDNDDDMADDMDDDVSGDMDDDVAFLAHLLIGPFVNRPILELDHYIGPFLAHYSKPIYTIH